MKEYAEKPYHLILNVSEPEGIPVSIMEVLSFGIPCIVTDVGGTREIIQDRYNGILLEKDFKKELWLNGSGILQGFPIRSTRGTGNDPDKAGRIIMMQTKIIWRSWLFYRLKL